MGTLTTAGELYLLFVFRLFDKFWRRHGAPKQFQTAQDEARGALGADFRGCWSSLCGPWGRPWAHLGFTWLRLAGP